MKKYLLLITFVLGSFYSQGQKLKDIILKITLKQYEQAKPELDSYLSNPTNAAAAEGWYYKAYLYNTLGRMESKSITERSNLLQQSFEAVKKYAELDAKAPLTKEEENGTVFNTYYAFDDLGIKSYNDKNIEEAYNSFQKALAIHAYIVSKDLTGYQGAKFSTLDTTMVWNLAILANDLKKKDEAFSYYRQIADANLRDEKYAGAYDELILKYKAERNDEAFTKYLNSAKEYFPIDKSYWESQQIEYAIKDLDDEALVNKYADLAVALPDNYYVFYNYAVELDRFIALPAAKGKDIPAMKLKVEELYKKALSINSTIEANLQLASLYYSRSFDNKEQAARIRGTKPEEVKLKNELLAKGKENLNKCIPYAEAGVKLLAGLKELKYSDKVNYKLALEILGNAAKQNGDAAKAADYEKQREAIDKM